MTHSFKLSRRIARLRAPLLATLALALGACDGSDVVEPQDVVQPEVEVLGLEPELATYAGGIPFGLFAMPNGAFGELYNGALRLDWPEYLLKNLADIKARGGKVALMFAGNERHYKNADGTFSLSKWKARIDRYKRVNFSRYVTDGTIIGHYLIDEPNDPANWSGRPVPGTMVDEMARYSKQLWPGLTTIVRAEPGHFRSAPRYVDAAWAQYTTRKGNVNDFIRRNVSTARDRGLALIVGLNLLTGGNNRTKLSASQVQTYGSALLGSTYPCAFISWKYDSRHLSTSSMKTAMKSLRRKAQSRGSRRCRV